MIDIKADYMKLKACWLQDNMTKAKKLTKQKKIKEKWHRIFLLITNTCDIIAFSTVTK